MNDILLVITDNNQKCYDNKNFIRKILPLNKIFYKSRLIDSINESLVEININITDHFDNYKNKFYTGNFNNDENRKLTQRVFIIRIPEIYLDARFYGKKGIKKSYNAKKLIVDKVNLFCQEEGIEMHFYSNKLIEFYHIEFQNRLASELLLYGDATFERSHKRKKYYENEYDDIINNRKKNVHLYNNFEGDPANLGKLLFRSLTLEIIDIICKYKKIQLLQSEITIVGNKENKYDVLAMTWKLSQLAKYITIVTSDEDTSWIESEAEEIYNNTGLAINITNNYKSTTIKSEVLINYGNVFELSEYEGLKRRTIIINNSLNDYSLGNEKFRIRNPLIDKIEVDFPHGFPHELKGLAPEHFSTNQLAEIILGSKYGWIENKIEQSFKKEGFRIRSLSGSNLDFLT